MMMTFRLCLGNVTGNNDKVQESFTDKFETLENDQQFSTDMDCHYASGN